MNPDRWERIKDLFSRVCELPPAEHAVFLEQECGGDEELRREIDSLLVAHRETGGNLETAISPSFAPPVDPLVGRMLGVYRIVRQIGRGGMGAVYLAERADDQFRRLVAIKAVHSEFVDEETLRWFQNERQTLAVLDHPNIIKLLDGGTADDGAPYLVMDYVEGQPIDEYVESHKLSTNDRLRLFRTVCAAVGYAHQNLVVHRDLKPSNILITPTGVPKLLDFGISKMLKPEYSSVVAITRKDLRAMTPEYASPEQILGQPITTASDIYSLGVLLYRLLTGQYPFHMSALFPGEIDRLIGANDPGRPKTPVASGASDGREPRPSQLKGDLDMIVQMAMRKEPQRRYPTVDHFSEDVRRYLEGLPVRARKASFPYRAVKFVTRNKAGVGVAIAIAIALISSTLMAQHQQQIAEKRFQELRQFANFALTDLDDAMRAGITPARKKLVGKAMEYLDALAREERNDASIQRDLVGGYLKMGDIQGNLYESNLGESNGAEQSYRKALSIAERLTLSSPNDPDSRSELAAANRKLADVLALTGRGKEAVDQYNKALSIYEQLRTEHPSNPDYLKRSMQVWDKLGSTEDRMGDQVAALQSYRRCLAVGEAWLASGSDPKAREAVAFVRERVAYFSAMSGDTAGAEEVIREALRTYESAAAQDPSPAASRNIAKGYKTMAEVEKRTAKLPQALDSVRKSLRISEDLLAKDPRNLQFQVDLQQALVLLVDILILNGETKEAHTETVRALRFLLPLAEAPDASVYPIFDSAWLLLTTPFPDLENNPAAFRYARRAVTLTHENDPSALDLLARAYAKNSDFANALAVEQKAIGILPPADPSRGVSELRKMLEANATNFRLGKPAALEAPPRR